MPPRKRASSAGKSAKTETIKGGAGQTPVSFEKGGLHKSLGVPEGKKIPPAKMKAALNGEHGPKAQKQATMATGMLAAGRKTAAKNKGKGTTK